jgi:hypothetical protein
VRLPAQDSGAENSKNTSGKKQSYDNRDAPIDLSLDMLRILYPDINPKAKTIITDDLRWDLVKMLDFNIKVCEPSHSGRSYPNFASPSTKYDIECSRLIVEAGFSWRIINNKWMPLQVLVYRPEIEERSVELYRLTHAREVRSPGEMAILMEESGVKYASKNKSEFLRIFPKEVFERFYGKMDFKPARYDVTNSKSQKEQDMLEPVWLVNAETHNTRGDDIEVRFTFSGVDGKLDSMDANVKYPARKR